MAKHIRLPGRSKSGKGVSPRGVTLREIDTGDVDTFEALTTKVTSGKPLPNYSKSARVVAQSVGSWAEGFVRGVPGNVEKRGYRLRVAIAGYWMTPRDSDFDYFVDLGMVHLEPILHHEPITAAHITLIFPERWLSVHEQRMLIPLLDTHPEVKTKKLVDCVMLTQSPLIVGSCHQGEITLVQTEHAKGLHTDQLDMIYKGSNYKDAAKAAQAAIAAFMHKGKE